MKTSELKDAGLDWAVAKTLGQNVDIHNNMITQHRPLCYYWNTDVMDMAVWEPHLDWSQGGPIIEREKICTMCDHSGVWIAYIEQNYADEKRFMQSGPTPLIAAMRCFVASKLGNNVDVPKELL